MAHTPALLLRLDTGGGAGAYPYEAMVGLFRLRPQAVSDQRLQRNSSCYGISHSNLILRAQEQKAIGFDV